MAEQAGAVFGQSPVLRVRPERGNFLTGKSGADADHGVVARHVVAADEPEQFPGDRRQRGTLRFDGDEQFCILSNLAEQLSQPPVLEVMQKQIRDDDFIRAGGERPVKNIGDDGFGVPAESGKCGERFGGDIFLEVEQGGQLRR